MSRSQITRAELPQALPQAAALDALGGDGFFCAAPWLELITDLYGYQLRTSHLSPTDGLLAAPAAGGGRAAR